MDHLDFYYVNSMKISTYNYNFNVNTVNKFGVISYWKQEHNLHKDTGKLGHNIQFMI